ncbi:MAG TPA: efflux RND transporter permease subunit [Pirellulaceae bacterium]|jgi:HAE1 family hydrophobic/amphiphilic exporter-1|nr:efflux RND transporter permease subunit [Pirellulaceae bacterium]
MNLIRAFVESPIKVAVGVLMVSLFGIVALLRMPMQLTPEVETPTLTVETRWPGASPQEVEQEIVLEQESQLKSVEGIVKMSSESSDSQGRVILEFLVGTDMNEAMLQVNSRLNQVREYPEDADQPVISTSNVNDRPIARFMLSARPPSDEELVELQRAHSDDDAFVAALQKIRETENPGLANLRIMELAEEREEAKVLLPPADLDVTQLRRFAEDEIEARFERVAGVSQAEVQGGLEDELQVVVDPERLAARGLTIDGVAAALRGQNQDTSAGDYYEGKRRYVVRTLGQFRSTEQVERQLLAVQGGAPIYVRDVAEVRMGYKKPEGIVRRYGSSSVGVNALREVGANVLDVMKGLQDTADELNAGLLADRGLLLVQVYDETDYINSAVDLVQENIVIGGALTMIVLLLFLHLGVRTLVAVPLILGTALAASYFSPWYFALTLAIVVGVGFWYARGALVVGLAIPISIVGTFLVLQALGRSLNVVSLAGLAFAVGMLVDNAVVVLENIYRRYDDLGEDPFTAAIRGTGEVWGAVLSSTLTTVAVFLPIVFIQEEAGQLFRDIALAISAAVSLSMIVAIVVIPPAAARLFKKSENPLATGAAATAPSNGAANRSAARAPKGILSLQSFVQRVAGGLVDLIVGFTAWVQKGIVRRLAISAALVAACIAVTIALWPKVEYLPSGNRNLVIGILMPPPGYNMDQLMAMGQQVEADLKPYWDVDPDGPEAAKLDYPPISDFFFVARGKQVFMGLKTHDPADASKLIPLVRKVGSRFPGTFVVAKQTSLFERGISAGRTIEVEIVGPDLERLVAMGGRIMGDAKKVLPESTQMRPVPSLDLSSPELHIEPKLIQSAEMGVTSTSLGYAANALVDGAYVGDYFLEGDKIDLTIIGESRLADSSQAIRSLPVATPTGQLVPLEALAEVRLASGPEQVNHRERVRAIAIEISPPPEMPLQDAMETIQSQVVGPLQSSDDFPPGYRITLAGTADKLRETWNSLQFNLLLALLITYLLMAALFESWLYPLVIIFSVPTGAVGGVLGLWLLNFFYLQTLDVLTMLGFVILIGTVVNNPILIVHQALNLMREGMATHEAVRESVRSRIRPIFMTTTTTVLGLAPLVIFPGAGAELYRGLGAVVLGGLVVSTIVSLVLVPTLFTLTVDAKSWINRTLGRKSREQRNPLASPVATPAATRPVHNEDREEKPAAREYVIAETTAGN